MARRKSASDPTRQATLDQAERGIYIDFEGFKDTEPSLLGILVESDLDQVVLDPGLAPAGEAKGLRVSDLESEIAGLSRRAGQENRFIFGFTRRELNVVEKYTSRLKGFEPLYKDGHKIAKMWVNKHHHGELEGRKTLDSFLHFIGKPPLSVCAMFETCLPGAAATMH